MRRQFLKLLGMGGFLGFLPTAAKAEKLSTVPHTTTLPRTWCEQRLFLYGLTELALMRAINSFRAKTGYRVTSIVMDDLAMNDYFANVRPPSRYGSVNEGGGMFRGYIVETDVQFIAPGVNAMVHVDWHLPDNCVLLRSEIKPVRLQVIGKA